LSQTLPRNADWKPPKRQTRQRGNFSPIWVMRSERRWMESSVWPGCCPTRHCQTSSRNMSILFSKVPTRSLPSSTTYSTFPRLMHKR
jgi:hypothetical protein